MSTSNGGRPYIPYPPYPPYPWYSSGSSISISITCGRFGAGYHWADRFLGGFDCGPALSASAVFSKDSCVSEETLSVDSNYFDRNLGSVQYNCNQKIILVNSSNFVRFGNNHILLFKFSQSYLLLMRRESWHQNLLRVPAFPCPD